MDTKYKVGIFIGILALLGGGYTITFYEDKIVVDLPSSVCSKSTLRVTKDDFTLKCGRRIAFQADTLVEYYKTYGPDEWVRNVRFVGRNKKDIELYLVDKGDSFEISRVTRYRKGRQSVADGTLTESYIFTGDKVKISYDYEVQNSAKHRITMRIKKQYRASLDAFDPFGNTGVQQGNLLSYENYGNLKIDPTVAMTGSPKNFTKAYKEGDTISLLCNVTKPRGENISNVSIATTMNGTWVVDETTFPSDITNNLSVTYAIVIPHQFLTGTFNWTCIACNTTNLSQPDTCKNSSQSQVDPFYAPNPINITGPAENINFNLLNGTGWGLLTSGLAYTLASTSDDGFIYINWTTYPIRAHPDSDNITWNVSIQGTTNISWLNLTTFDSLNGTIGYVTIDTTNSFNQTAGSNQTRNVSWNVGALLVDDYIIKVEGCSQHNYSAPNLRLCTSDTTIIPVEVFDYTLLPLTTILRFSPQSNLTLGPALGQTNSIPWLKINWEGYLLPTGFVNLTMNHSQLTKCFNLSAGTTSDSSSAVTLSPNVSSRIINVTDADPDSIWIFGSKSSCGTSTTAFDIDIEVLD